MFENLSSILGLNSIKQPTTSTLETPKPSPAGIGSTKTTVSSNQQEQGFIQIFFESVKIIFKAIADGIRKVFYALFPFKNIFKRDEKVNEDEMRYLDYQRKLRQVDSMSYFLAKKQAEDILPYFNSFEKLGETEIKRTRSFFSYFVRTKPSLEEKIQIGKKTAKKKPLELIAVLKKFYAQEIERLTKKLKPKENSN